MNAAMPIKLLTTGNAARGEATTGRAPGSVSTDAEVHGRELERFYHPGRRCQVGLEREAPATRDFRRTAAGERSGNLVRGVDGEVPVVAAVAASPEIALLRLCKDLHAIDTTCTHGAASLCGGFVEEAVSIECPPQQGRLDVRALTRTMWAPCASGPAAAEDLAVADRQSRQSSRLRARLDRWLCRRQVEQTDWR